MEGSVLEGIVGVVVAVTGDVVVDASVVAADVDGEAVGDCVVDGVVAVEGAAVDDVVKVEGDLVVAVSLFTAGSLLGHAVSKESVVSALDNSFSFIAICREGTPGLAVASCLASPSPVVTSAPAASLLAG